MSRAHLSVLLIAASVTLAQTAPKLEYEVASVKPAPPPEGGRILVGGRGGPGTPDPTQVTYNNATVKMLLTNAYNVKSYQVTGPSWIDTERYNIQAKIPEGTTPEQHRIMLQNLLADRFKIVLHHESKESPLYELTQLKTGSKLKPTAGDPNAPPPPPPSGPPGPPPIGKDGMPELPKNGKGMMMMFTNGKARVGGNVQAVSSLADMLANQLGMPVVDKTGLTGFYDFTLDFAPDSLGGRGGPGGLVAPPPPPGAAPEAAAPSDLAPLLTAVQEQLGLKLDKTKGPLDLIVVDKGDKVPTEN
ncbi:MAG TPA: TIGR03435 family protein [Bryobacteraceae bacterium]|jgi:uncharacterized protein (TIGR03435 family)